MGRKPGTGGEDPTAVQKPGHSLQAALLALEKLWREIAGKKVFPLEPSQMRDMDGSVTQGQGDRAAGFHQRGDVSKDELRGIVK